MLAPAAPPTVFTSGAATSRVRDLLAGPPRTGEVVHTGTDAAYADVCGRVVGVLSLRASHVPCAIRTSLQRLDARLAPGDSVLVDHGALHVGRLSVQVVRIVPAGLPDLDVRRARAALAAVRPRPNPACVELPAAALTALRDGQAAAVPALLGRGGGLTPVGDDVLCGWLATARRTRAADFEAIAAAVRRDLRRTTALSAELLRCAIEGDVLPEFRAIALALAEGDQPTVDTALDDLLRVGHTSGAGLALGLQLALDGGRA